MNCELRLYLDEHAAKSAPLRLPEALARAMYVVEGSLALRDAEGATLATLGANSAFLAEAQAVGGGSAPARVLRWELVPAGAQNAMPAELQSRLLLAAPLRLSSAEDYLLRCDRVDFPAGGEALTHTHQGGGVRCLLFGSIRIDTQGTRHGYGPMGAWFEAGPEPVYAAADAVAPSAFVRVMVLPRALLGGKSSIAYVNTDDIDKPKSQRYQIFIDQPIERTA